MPTRRALVSVSDKRGLEVFVRGILELGFEVFASEGTRSALAKTGLKVGSVEELTGEPEFLGGRVKTLSPRIHAAILAVRNDKEHMAQLGRRRIKPIDLVVSNLYPFEASSAHPQNTLEALIEEIDVGGVALIRAAAKNWRDVGVVVSPAQYEGVLLDLRENGSLRQTTREGLALEAFAYTSGYDAIIYNELWRRLRPASPIPEALRFGGPPGRPLRYGENPDQMAAFFRRPSGPGLSVASAEQLIGRELSFNNLLDFDAALGLAHAFDDTACAIIKHTNPAGVATAATAAEAYAQARATDPRSAYGCIVGFNAEVDEGAATAMRGHFVEGIIAPGFAARALEALAKRKNLRVLRTGAGGPLRDLQAVGIRGGILVQTRPDRVLTRGDLRVVTRRAPSEEEVEGLLFSSRILGHVKSNAIVLAKGHRTVGIGAGQMSRVDAVVLAVTKAGAEARGSALASDAFFPFRDGIDEAAKGGVTAVVQAGGSIRDAEVIAAADEHNMAMAFTGVRMFKH